MSKSRNEVNLRGNVGNDPETRTTPGGTVVTQLSLATNQRWRDKVSGADRERTDWHRIVAWGKQAETLAAHVHKGDELEIKGEIRYRSYEGSDGATRYVTEIHVRDFWFSGKPAKQEKPAAPAPVTVPADLEDELW